MRSWLHFLGSDNAVYAGKQGSKETSIDVFTCCKIHAFCNTFGMGGKKAIAETIRGGGMLKPGISHHVKGCALQMCRGQVGSRDPACQLGKQSECLISSAPGLHLNWAGGQEPTLVLVGDVCHKIEIAIHPLYPPL